MRNCQSQKKHEKLNRRGKPRMNEIPYYYLGNFGLASLTFMQSDFEQGTGDDWTRTHDRVERKTIQNRLAQRKRREKVLRSKNASAEDETSTQITKRGNRKRPPAPTSNAAPNHNAPLPSNELVQGPMADLPVEHYLEVSALSEHRFLCLSEYSVQRAFICNATMLSIDASLLENDDGVSPWTLMNPFIAPSESFPQSLKPTPLQLQTYHHPFLDMLAPTGLRDNALLAMLDDDQEDDLCRSFHHDGLKVWGGQPWSPVGWEFSQSFADRWGWLLDAACVESSNFWRFERGEPPLKLTGAVEIFR
ncbi:MAG: hypothetical protein Q9216_000605 [Gyalolechia sp. 2 TL-2023]